MDSLVLSCEFMVSDVKSITIEFWLEIQIVSVTPTAPNLVEQFISNGLILGHL